MRRYSFNAFYTPCDLILNHDLKSVCDNAASIILQYSKKLEEKYSFFNQSSFLNQINNRKTSKISLDFQTNEILQSVIFLMQKTEYAFDIAYSGTIKQCFNLDTLQNMQEKKSELLKYATHECFELKNQNLMFSNSFTKLDLGGVIKEYAVDEAAKILEQCKIRSALINFGGDIKVIGTKNGEKWRIGIKNPKNPEVDLKIVEICDTALTTSGHYERKYSLENESFSFIMQKENFHSKFIQATAIHSSAMASGIFSTSLLINDNINPLEDMQILTIDNGLNIYSNL